MPPRNFKTKNNLSLPQNPPSVFVLSQFFLVLLVVGFNLAITFFIRSQNIFFDPNFQPIGYFFGYYSSVALLFLVSWTVLKFKIMERNPVWTILVLGGIYANFLEKLFWGQVADYLSIATLNFNLADIQIFLGLVSINFQAWFGSVLESQSKLKTEKLV